MSPRRSPQRLQRKTGTRKPKKRLLIVCEGPVTEVQYFKGVTAYLKALPVEVVEPDCIGKGLDPQATVTFAARKREQAGRSARGQRDSFLRYDEVWCVVDVDDHTTLETAISLAWKKEINLVVSRPCFELWLLLHFQDFPVRTNRFDVQRKVKSHIPDYDKHLPSDFPYEQFDQAKKRARHIDPQHCAPNRKGDNPSSNVWLVVDAISASGSRPVK